MWRGISLWLCFAFPEWLTMWAVNPCPTWMQILDLHFIFNLSLLFVYHFFLLPQIDLAILSVLDILLWLSLIDTLGHNNLCGFSLLTNLSGLPVRASVTWASLQCSQVDERSGNREDRAEKGRSRPLSRVLEAISEIQGWNWYGQDNSASGFLHIFLVKYKKDIAQEGAAAN